MDLPLTRPVWGSNPGPPASEPTPYRLGYRCHSGGHGDLLPYEDGDVVHVRAAAGAVLSAPDLPADTAYVGADHKAGAGGEIFKHMLRARMRDQS